MDPVRCNRLCKGGIIEILWCDEYVEIDYLSSTAQFLHVSVEVKDSNKKFLFTGVNAEPS